MDIRSLARGAVLLALLAAIALLSPLAAPASAELGHFDATSSVTVGSVAPGAARALTLTMATPAGDMLDAGIDPFSAGPGPIVFEPIGVTITPGCNKAGYRDFNNDNVTDAGETPCLAQGAAAGTHTWQAKLGLSNGPCSTATTVTVDLFNVAMPSNELDPRLSTNIVYPRAQGATLRFDGWQIGSAPAVGTAPMDLDANGRAEAGSLAIQNYPSYLLDLADPDGAGVADPVLPLAVYGGLSKVNNEWIPFYFAQFESGDLSGPFAGLSPHPYERAAAPLGHLLQPVAGDPTAIVVGPTSITDVCAPSTTTTDLPATVGGVTRAANPASAGTHMVLAWRATQRDMENDGYENNIDSCPSIANVENPRSTAGPDGDMLDSACDPFPGSGATDEDGDGALNALDNCPLAANASQAEGERTYPPNYFAHAFDGGPTADHMGDACETGNTITASGSTLSPAITDVMASTMVYTGADVFAQHDYIQIDSEIMRISDVTFATNTLIVGRGQAGTTAATHANLAPISDIVGITVTLNGPSAPFVFSPPTGTGHWHARGDVFPRCYSTAPVDLDGDGYCAAGTAGCAGACIVDPADSGTCATTVPPSCSVRHNQWTTTPAFAHLLLFDTDRGGGDLTSVADVGGVGTPIACLGGLTDVCPENAFDSDWIETYTGIDTTRACAMTSGLHNEPLDAWVFDQNDDQRSNLSDTTAIGSVFNKFAGQVLTYYYGTSITLTSTVGSGDTTLTYTSASDPVVVGDTIAIDFELMQVTVVDTVANGLTVVRGVAPSVAATHNSGITIFETLYSTPASLSAGVSPGDTTVSYTSTGDPIVVGDFIALEYETIKVNTVDTVANTIEVVRGVLGTTASAHGGGTAIFKAAGTRFDVNGDGWSNLSDVLARGPNQGKQCRRMDGTFGAQQ